MPQLTPGELKVMKLLWEHGELKPSELQDRFPEPIKNPALRSYLTTLLEKGHVTRRRVGKAYFYKAVTRSRSAFRTMLGELVDSFCGGSVQNLVMNIIKSERLSEDELLELKRLAEGDDRPPSVRGAGNECTSNWAGSLASLADGSIGLILVAKWTLLLALAWLGHAVLARGNPRWRVVLWRGAMLGIGLVAALAAVPPLVQPPDRT